jgi:hypothetical protein
MPLFSGGQQASSRKFTKQWDFVWTQPTSDSLGQNGRIP